MARYIEPLGNHVLIEALEPVTKTAGGIVMPENYKTPSGEGKVVAVGKGRLNYQNLRVPIDINPGDHVFFNWLNGREVAMDGKTYRILDAEEVLGVIRSVPENRGLIESDEQKASYGNDERGLQGTRQTDGETGERAGEPDAGVREQAEREDEKAPGEPVSGA